MVPVTGYNKGDSSTTLTSLAITGWWRGLGAEMQRLVHLLYEFFHLTDIPQTFLDTLALQHSQPVNNTFQTQQTWTCMSFLHMGLPVKWSPKHVRGLFMRRAIQIDIYFTLLYFTLLYFTLFINDTSSFNNRTYHIIRSVCEHMKFGCTM